MLFGLGALVLVLFGAIGRGRVPAVPQAEVWGGSGCVSENQYLIGLSFLRSFGDRKSALAGRIVLGRGALKNAPFFIRITPVERALQSARKKIKVS
jgi:hypothetical protein